MIRSVLSTTLLLASSVSLLAQTTPTVPSFELAANNIITEGYSEDVIEGDFNNDGKPDIIVQGAGEIGSANYSQNNISLFLGKGDGTFQAPVVIAAADGIFKDLAVADFNHDGNLDLIIFNSDNNFTIYYGNGNGTFQAPLRFATAVAGSIGTVGTFFNDGYIDVAVADNDGNIDLYKNEGGKNFVLISTVAAVAPAGDILQIAAGDMNGTGVSDIGVMTTTGFDVLWNTGQGSFTKVLLSNYANPIAINLNDVNQDGRADIIVSYSCAESTIMAGHVNPSQCTGLDVYYGQGNNKTFFRNAVTDSSAAAPPNVFAADVNGDGIADLVASTSSTVPPYADGLFVWLGKPDGSFNQVPNVFNDGSTGNLAPGDFTRSGVMSFVQFSTSIEIFINGGQRGPCQTSTINPTVVVCQPVNNTYLPSPVTVQADARDKNKVTAMQEYIDGTLDYSEDVTSFDTSFPLSVGPHFLVTKAWDYTGLSFRSNRNITVFNGTPYPTCPAALGTANMCLPSTATTTSPVHILANGSTANIPSAVQLYIDNSLVISDSNTDTYIDTTQTLAPGSHDLVFKLWDGQGNVYTAQKTVTVQ